MCWAWSIPLGHVHLRRREPLSGVGDFRCRDVEIARVREGPGSALTLWDSVLTRWQSASVPDIVHSRRQVGAGFQSFVAHVVLDLSRAAQREQSFFDDVLHCSARPALQPFVETIPLLCRADFNMSLSNCRNTRSRGILGSGWCVPVCRVCPGFAVAALLSSPRL